eukprot:TRINITY_DN26427_c0_g1_i2.p1 TRINITY_DN26427_c0_g1~~TRINITY_DN26427_c0_g1_i2.p1  ORF type:complete len:203 (+),score=22.97 TRINITY_DN26427_c0_g1_i2:180-788(+)
MTQAGSAARVAAFSMQKEASRRHAKGAQRQSGPKQALSSSSVYPATAGANAAAAKSTMQNGDSSRGGSNDYPLMNSEIRDRVERLQQLGSCSADPISPISDFTPWNKDGATKEVGADITMVSKIVARTSKKSVRFSTEAPEVIEFVVADDSLCRRREKMHKDSFRLRQEPEDESTAEPKKGFASLDQLMNDFKRRQAPPASA